MPRIFISYRRDDSNQITGRVYDRLVYEFGKEDIFRDLDNIGLGINFRDHISSEISDCAVVLVIIGNKWVSITDDIDNKRLNDPNDLVRIEVEIALNYQPPKLIVPVLVNNAKMPKSIDLPESLQELVKRNAATVRDDPDFHRDMNRLIDELPTNDDYSDFMSSEGKVKFDWQVKFFPTTELEGNPVLITNVNEINFNWGAGVPNANGMAIPGLGKDNFSAEFSTNISVPQGTYKFIASSDNGLRIELDGSIILDKWFGRPLETDEILVSLNKGNHTIKVQYFHGIDQAIIQIRALKIKSKQY
jgi:hypothetical protein